MADIMHTEADDLFQPTQAASGGVPDIKLQTFDDGPRARDLDIAAALGFDRPRKIRELIERNLAELETFGPAPRRGALVKRPQGGTIEVQEYWLNEEQALLIAARSDADRAPEVRRMLIKVFVAWRRGDLAQAPALSDAAMKLLVSAAETIQSLSARLEVVEQGLPEIVAQQVEAAKAADPRRAVLDYVSVRQLLDDAGAIQKGRRSLNARIGHDLRIRALSTGASMARRCAHSDVWLFQRDFAAGYMREHGRELVRRHNAFQMGQGAFDFAPRRRRSTALHLVS